MDFIYNYSLNVNYQMDVKINMIPSTLELCPSSDIRKDTFIDQNIKTQVGVIFRRSS